MLNEGEAIEVIDKLLKFSADNLIPADHDILVLIVGSMIRKGLYRAMSVELTADTSDVLDER